MNDTVTFFRNMQQDQGMTCRLQVEVGNSLFSLSIYSRLPFEHSELLSDQKFNDNEAWQTYWSKLSDLIRQQGGGLIVMTQESNQQLSVEVYRIAATEPEAYLPPRHIICLQPGYSPAERPFDGTKLSLSLFRGSHLIVPVDEDAGNHFTSFRKNYSGWFPADFESLMLTMLKQPGLDLRVDRLQKIQEQTQEEIKKMAATSSEGAVSVAANVSKQEDQSYPLKRSVLAWIIPSVISGLTLLSILVLGFLGYRNIINESVNQADVFKDEINSLTSATNTKIDELSNSLKIIENKLSTPTVPKPSSIVKKLPLASPFSSEDVSDQIKGIINLLKNDNQRKKIPSLDTLWNTHFVSIKNLNNILDQNKTSDLFNDRAFIWGLIKLPVLINIEPSKPLEGENANFLQYRDQKSIIGAKKAYASVMEKLSDNEKIILAMLVCRVHDLTRDLSAKATQAIQGARNYNKATKDAEDWKNLLKTLQDNFIVEGNKTIFTETNCEDLNQNGNLLPGMEELNDDLNKMLTSQ